MTRVVAVVLAAGSSTRMTSPDGEHTNKLLAHVGGVPLVRRVVDAAVASKASGVVVVTGHDEARVRGAIGEAFGVRFVHNPAYATGMASSLVAGVAAVASEPAVGGVAICLADMPRVTAAQLDAVLAAFAEADDDRAIVVPVWNERRGHPVVWGRAHFAALGRLAGDVGARGLLDQHAADVRTVPAADDGILVDVDTPDALAKASSRPQ